MAFCFIGKRKIFHVVVEDSILISDGFAV